MLRLVTESREPTVIQADDLMFFRLNDSTVGFIRPPERLLFETVSLDDKRVLHCDRDSAKSVAKLVAFACGLRVLIDNETVDVISFRFHQ